MSTPDTNGGHTHQTTHLLLLTPTDTTNPQSLPRIRQLYSLPNANTALVFLLDNDSYNSNNPETQTPMHAFMDLHIQYATPANSLHRKEIT